MKHYYTEEETEASTRLGGYILIIFGLMFIGLMMFGLWRYL